MFDKIMKVLTVFRRTAVVCKATKKISKVKFLKDTTKKSQKKDIFVRKDDNARKSKY